MTLRAVALIFLGVLAGCDPCDQSGHAYTCTCTKRCQGQTTTSNPSFACETDEPTGSVTAACEDSCDPAATCTCSCTEGAACTLETACS